MNNTAQPTSSTGTSEESYSIPALHMLGSDFAPQDGPACSAKPTRKEFMVEIGKKQRAVQRLDEKSRNLISLYAAQVCMLFVRMLSRIRPNSSS